MFGIESSVILIAFIMFAVIVVAMWLSVNFYQKCPPNQAMIISGLGAQDGDIPYKIVRRWRFSHADAPAKSLSQS
jgi:uncharacterized membrane protein YqiK